MGTAVWVPERREGMYQRRPPERGEVARKGPNIGVGRWAALGLVYEAVNSDNFICKLKAIAKPLGLP